MLGYIVKWAATVRDMKLMLLVNECWCCSYKKRGPSFREFTDGTDAKGHDHHFPIGIYKLPKDVMKCSIWISWYESNSIWNGKSLEIILDIRLTICGRYIIPWIMASKIWFHNISRKWKSLNWEWPSDLLTQRSKCWRCLHIQNSPNKCVAAASRAVTFSLEGRRLKHFLSPPPACPYNPNWVDEVTVVIIERAG